MTGGKQEIDEERIERDRAQEPSARKIIDPGQSQQNSGKAGKGAVVKKRIGRCASKGNEIENGSNSCKS
jgi:hypothetical protein